MVTIPKRVGTRLSSELRRYQKVLAAAAERDLNESDTVTIVRDLLADLFGFDKYTEITSEYEIRGSYCDLAIKLGSSPAFLIEVKAIGLDLKENHLRQAVSYGATKGVEWCVLTNGVVWQAHRIHFEKPIKTEEVFRLNLLEASPRDSTVMESLFLLSREGLKKAAISEYHETKKATNRYMLAAVLLSDPVASVVRRELRKITSNVKISTEEISQRLRTEVIKRDALSGEAAEEAEKAVKRQKARVVRKQQKSETEKMVSG